MENIVIYLQESEWERTDRTFDYEEDDVKELSFDLDDFFIEPGKNIGFVKIWFGRGYITLSKKRLIDAFNEYKLWTKDANTRIQQKENELMQKHELQKE